MTPIPGFSQLLPVILSFIAEYSADEDVESFQKEIKGLSYRKTDKYSLTLEDLRTRISEKDSLILQKQIIENLAEERLRTVNSSTQAYTTHISSSFFRKTITFFNNLNYRVLTIIGKLVQRIFPCIKREVELQNAMKEKINTCKRDHKIASDSLNLRLKSLNEAINEEIPYEELFSAEASIVSFITLSIAKEKLRRLESFCKVITNLFSDMRLFEGVPLLTNPSEIHSKKMTIQSFEMEYPIMRGILPEDGRHFFAIRLQAAYAGPDQCYTVFEQYAGDSNLTWNIASLQGHDCISNYPLLVDHLGSVKNSESFNRIKTIIRTGKVEIIRHRRFRTRDPRFSISDNSPTYKISYQLGNYQPTP